MNSECDWHKGPFSSSLTTISFVFLFHVFSSLPKIPKFKQTSSRLIINRNGLVMVLWWCVKGEQTSKEIALNQFLRMTNLTRAHYMRMRLMLYSIRWIETSLICNAFELVFEILIVNLLRIHLFFFIPFPFFMCHILCSHLANLQWTLK